MGLRADFTVGRSHPSSGRSDFVFLADEADSEAKSDSTQAVGDADLDGERRRRFGEGCDGRSDGART